MEQSDKSFAVIYMDENNKCKYKTFTFEEAKKAGVLDSLGLTEEDTKNLCEIKIRPLNKK